MRHATLVRRAPMLRVWLLVAAALIAVIAAQSDHNGPPGDHDGEHKGDNNGPPGDHNGPPGDHNGPPGDNHGPPGDGGGHDGEQHGGLNGDEGRPPSCTSAQTQAALEASTEFVKCTGLNYEDFLALVHTDVEVLEKAAECFTTSVEEIEHEVQDKKEDAVVDAKSVFAKCVEEVETADNTQAAKSTAEFLEAMLGAESEVCSCLPAYVDKMPLCDLWVRYHHFGMHLETVCDAIDTASLPVDGRIEQAAEAATPEAKKTEMNEVDPNAGVKVTEEEPHQPHIPDAYGPCPVGEEVHPTDPSQCQPAQAKTETYNENASGGSDERGGPPQGGMLGLGVSVLGTVAIGGAIGVAGVWAWGKFQSGTRQPGVRYMATGGVGDDIGTELGPFGREYP